MSDLKEIFIRTLAERVAVELIKERGQKWTKSSVAGSVADALEEFIAPDVERLVKLTLTYIEVADVSVGIPVWRVKEDGTIRTEEELREGSKAW